MLVLAPCIDYSTTCVSLFLFETRVVQRSVSSVRLPALGAVVTVFGSQVEWNAFRTHRVPTARHHVGEFRQADEGVKILCIYRLKKTVPSLLFFSLEGLR